MSVRSLYVSLPPFESVVAEHGAIVLRVCLAVLGPDDAEDAWSETFLAALRAYPRLRPDSHLPARLDDVAHEIDDYFAARRRTFDLPLDLRLTRGFRREVLTHLRDISYGSTASYAVLAAAAGRPAAVRAVGTACALNPLPIVIPRATVSCEVTDRSGAMSAGSPLSGHCSNSRPANVTRWQPAALSRYDEHEPLGSTPRRSRLGPGCRRAGHLRVRADPATAYDGRGSRYRGLYEVDARFRSTVDMSRHRYREGEYRYFDRPYPAPVERLEQTLYPRLLPIARDWYARSAAPVRHRVSTIRSRERFTLGLVFHDAA